MNINSIVNFFYELNHLKRQKHVGLMRVGLKEVDSIAEHVFRASQIAYVLAVLENCDPEKTAMMVLIHDNGEARVGDQDKVQATYYNNSQAEKNAFFDQCSLLPEEMQSKWQEYMSEYSDRNTKEGIVAKDADWLELAFEAKEKLDTGYKGARVWLDNIKAALETKAAKEIFAKMQETDFNDWYRDLKTMTYKKLNK